MPEPTTKTINDVMTKVQKSGKESRFPWFKFSAADWLAGRITQCSFEAIGVFSSICAIYWTKRGSLELSWVRERYWKNENEVNELIKSGVLKTKDNLVRIAFLDEQLSECAQISQSKKAAADARWMHAASKVNAEERRRDKNTITKKQSAVPSDGSFAKCIEVYDLFCKSRNTPMKIGEADGAAMKQIIAYFKAQWPKQAPEVVLKRLLDSWHKMSDNYLSSRIRLRDINSNLPIIIEAMKVPKFATEKGNLKRSLDEQREEMGLTGKAEIVDYDKLRTDGIE